MVTVLCKFTGHKKGDRCEVCGWVLPWDVPRPPKRACNSNGPPPPPLTPEQVADAEANRERYFGDYTKKLLESTTLFGLFPDGITPDVVKAIKEKHGWPPTCQCPERQEWLNNVDKTARSWARKGIAWLKKKFAG